MKSTQFPTTNGETTLQVDDGSRVLTKRPDDYRWMIAIAPDHRAHIFNIFGVVLPTEPGVDKHNQEIFQRMLQEIRTVSLMALRRIRDSRPSP